MVMTPSLVHTLAQQHRGLAGAQGCGPCLRRSQRPGDWGTGGEGLLGDEPRVRAIQSIIHRIRPIAVCVIDVAVVSIPCDPEASDQLVPDMRHSHWDT
jgi:hypothetical protein